MSATEDLRRLLDERGVKYRFNDATKVFEWHFDGTDGEGSAYATEVNGGVNIIACSLTPEQVIATALGPGTCRDTWDTELTGRLRFQCSECGAVSLEIVPRFCPNCGAKVVNQ